MKKSEILLNTIINFTNNDHALAATSNNNWIAPLFSSRYEMTPLISADQSLSVFSNASNVFGQWDLWVCLLLQCCLGHPCPSRYFSQLGFHSCTSQVDFGCSLHLPSSMGCFQSIRSNQRSKDNGDLKNRLSGSDSSRGQHCSQNHAWTPQDFSKLYPCVSIGLGDWWRKLNFAPNFCFWKSKWFVLTLIYYTSDLYLSGKQLGKNQDWPANEYIDLQLHL